jgi:hypothetical protein
LDIGALLPVDLRNIIMVKPVAGLVCCLCSEGGGWYNKSSNFSDASCYFCKHMRAMHSWELRNEVGLHDRIMEASGASALLQGHASIFLFRGNALDSLESRTYLEQFINLTEAGLEMQESEKGAVIVMARGL